MSRQEQARKHYRELLSEVYQWSTWAHGDPVERAYQWLKRQDLLGVSSALDLGAGFGPHTLSLAREGVAVTAVDFDQGLLLELGAALKPDQQVEVVCDELVGFLEAHHDRRWELVLCLGDTLTHLGDASLVRRLLGLSAQALKPGGQLILSWRDTSTMTLEGVARFIPVAADTKRTMHCLLEIMDEDYIRVTDMVTTLGADGPRTQLSDYFKLRLSASQIIQWAHEAGLQVRHQALYAGMIELRLGHH